MEKKLLITIDTEALPARASDNHVEKLIWGQFENGRAGIIEICDLIEEFGGKGLFFLDVAGSFDNLAAYREVNSYLERRGHMVEWHYHPEIMGKAFWKTHGTSGKTVRQDLFDGHDANIILSAGLEQFIRITGRKPNAYRAGSFRWNQHTIDFLAEHNIGYSFNASRETSIKDNYETYCPSSPKPFDWPQGVREVPCGEVELNKEVIHFRLPRRFRGGLKPRVLTDQIAKEAGGIVNILLHSWSLLDRDSKTGFFLYNGDERIAIFRKILRQSLSNSMTVVSELTVC